MENWPFKLKTTYSFGITYDADTRNSDGDNDNDDEWIKTEDLLLVLNTNAQF